MQAIEGTNSRMLISGHQRLWYVAYGSNVDDERFGRYLDAEPGDSRVAGDEVRWIDIDRELYFAGRSKTWGGPVAFLSLNQDPSVSTRARARLLDVDDVEQVARRENGGPLGAAVLPGILPDVNCWGSPAAARPRDEGQVQRPASLARHRRHGGDHPDHRQAARDG